MTGSVDLMDQIGLAKHAVVDRNGNIRTGLPAAPHVVEFRGIKRTDVLALVGDVCLMRNLWVDG